MAKFGLGTVLGASAAGAYGMQQYNQTGVSGVWNMLPGNWSTSTGGAQPGASMQIDALQNELRRLTGMMGDMARNSNRPTVVQVAPNGRSGWVTILVPTAAVGGVVLLYCRVTGTSVWDLFFVSRSSLAQFRNTMQESLGKVWEEMKRQKDEVLRLVNNLGKQQGELGKKQDAMDERLRRVDEVCSQLDDKANHTIERMQHIGNHVERVEGQLQDVHAGVTAANHGIFMLVSAVSEVTQRIGLHNSKTAKALKAYAEGGPAWTARWLGGGSSSSAVPLPAVPEPLPVAASLPAPGSTRESPLSSAGGGSGRQGVGTGVAQLGLRGVMEKVLGDSSTRSTPFSSSSSFSTAGLGTGAGSGAVGSQSAGLAPFSLVVDEEGGAASIGPDALPPAKLDAALYQATSFTGR